MEKDQKIDRKRERESLIETEKDWKIERRRETERKTDREKQTQRQKKVRQRDIKAGR